MYNIVLNNVTKRYEYEELIRIFLPEDEFEVYALEQHRQGEYITPQELAEQTGNLPTDWNSPLMAILKLIRTN